MVEEFGPILPKNKLIRFNLTWPLLSKDSVEIYDTTFELSQDGDEKFFINNIFSDTDKILRKNTLDEDELPAIKMLVDKLGTI